jgi:hypothetical protein
MTKVINYKENTVYILSFLFIFDLFQTFSRWINDNFTTLNYIKNNLAVCPPYFQDCLRYYFLDNTPVSYGQNILYMILGIFLFLALYFLYVKDYNKFLLFVSVPFLYKIFYQYFLTYLVPGNYNVLGIFFGLVLLFSTYKIFYLRVLLVSFYFCAAVVKIHEGYFTGSVFSSLNLGVPLIPNIFLSYVGILFFLLCIIAPVFLLFSKNKNTKLISLIMLTCFHLYSITMVSFRYPILIIPILWLLFYFEKEDFVLDKKYLKDYFSIFIIGFMFSLQVIPLFIKGDERLTGEGYRYGYYMYDGNHQCESVKNIYFKDGANKIIKLENKIAMNSCDPYEEWFKIKRLCNPEKVEKVEWTYGHSLNGDKYKRIVNVENACLLNYKAFSHNKWINEKGEYTEKEVIKNSIE